MKNVQQFVHRTFAAIMASVAGVAILTMLNDRPTMTDMVVWMDIETLLLLFSMMILVAILTDTGVFDYIAVYTFKVSVYGSVIRRISIANCKAVALWEGESIVVIAYAKLFIYYSSVLHCMGIQFI